MLRLSFRSKGKDVYVGDFLNEEDKKILKDDYAIVVTLDQEAEKSLETVILE